MNLLPQTEGKGPGGNWKQDKDQTNLPILRRTALQAEVSHCALSEGVALGYYLVVPSRHRSAYGVLPSTLKGLLAHSPGQSEATPWVTSHMFYLTDGLHHTHGNKTETARLLKIGLTTLYRKIEEYGIIV